jgi:alcohol dehydrogenase
MLPFIAIPTTGGTGSECQSAALIVDEQTHEKMACLDTKVAARVAVLDPLLTLSQPAKVTACTGMDALAHAVETAVTRKRSRLSWMYSRESFRLCVENFPKVVKEPGNVVARGGMLLGAAFAGIAIENSMLGAAHAAANPLTAHFGVVHGTAVGIMLPQVVRFNSRDPVARVAYDVLMASAPDNTEWAGPGDDESPLAARLKFLLERAGLPRGLGEAGVKREKIHQMAAEAAAQWTASFNPVAAAAADFIKLYEAAF